jgi:hypothetical protein
MRKKNTNKFRGIVLVSLFICGLLAAIIFAPFQFTAKAVDKNSKKGLFVKTSSHADGLENYDIRKDSTKSDVIFNFRQSANKNAVDVADVRESFVRGEESLRKRVPTLKIEYNNDIRIPEVIATDVWQAEASFLNSPSSTRRSEILRNFARENNELIGVSDEQLNQLKVTADYTNPDGNLSFAHLEQFIKGIPVFRAEIKAGFTKTGQMIRVINNLAPGLEYESLSNEFYNPLNAVMSAARHIEVDAVDSEFRVNQKLSNDLKTVFERGSTMVEAEKMYFPTEPGVARPAWRVFIGKGVGAYYVIVDAETGDLLWRKNLTEDQTQSATYNVYINPNAFINVADSPFPFTPGPINPGLGSQGAAISRTSLTLIGNEPPYTFNNNGWITDGGNTTDGNNVESGLDRKLPNSGAIVAVASDTDPGGTATGSPSRTFNFAFVPGNPNTNSGDEPLPVGQSPATCLALADASVPTNYQKAITTQLFYIINRYHDEMYLLGFTESARNFQNSNFGRNPSGGTANAIAGNDRVAAQAQDCSGTDNANMTTPADGSRPTMQMYLWPGPTPDFDGSLDADVIIHEHTHGLSNRLHNNSSGLSDNMARGMGEGWGDFYGHAMLSEPTDPINGIYSTGGYATYLVSGGGGYTANYYYGIRRFPKAVMAFTGGPSNRPHNPLTFNDIDSTKIDVTDGAYPAGIFGGGNTDQVHKMGEVWSSALWEVRARFVGRHGWAIGNRKVLQIVTDGMKLAPTSPNFLQERDAIIAAALASALAPEANVDANDVRQGFRIRGMGFSASIQNEGTGANNTRVTEAFDSAPSAAMVEIGGRVTSSNGYGIGKAKVTLTDLRGNTSTAITNAFGYYRFSDVAVGENYVLQVSHKKYQFASRIISVFEGQDDVDFTEQ